VYKLGIWEPYVVKTQTLKLILRIDDVVVRRSRRPKAVLTRFE
jgi:hypothetical protein